MELNPIEGGFNFDHLRAIQRHILQDVYDWAGELRTTDTGAFGFPHARPQFLQDELDRVFHQLLPDHLARQTATPLLTPSRCTGLS